MDQAHSLRKMVLKLQTDICPDMRLLQGCGFLLQKTCQVWMSCFIDTESVESKTFISKTEYEYYIFAAKEVNFVEQFANHNIDVITLTDDSNESVLGIYSQIKLLLMRNIFNANKNTVKLVVGPVETKSAAERTVSNISSTVRAYLKHELELLGWFYDKKDGIGDIGYRYPSLRSTC